jgi:hypothetical protein
MSMTLRSAASAFLGIPPIFRRVKRIDPPRVRVEPVVFQPAPPVAKDRGIDVDKLLAATRNSAPVELSIIEWDGDAGACAALEPPAPVADEPASEETHPAGYDARSRRIRDRYIGARFPGVARSCADLEKPDRVVKSARLYFEDGQSETALELLDVAIEQDSRAEPLWLAQLEILFLTRNAPRFVEAARAFRAMHPASEAWSEVARLGRALAPAESLFGPAAGPRDHDHYGPWPDLPNWIQANWDLTAEVVASDFHRILKQRARVGGTMATKTAPQFQRPEGRAEFDRARNAAKQLLADASPDEALSAIARLDGELDEGVLKVKPGLLGSVLCWKPDDKTLCAWIYDQHCEFAELARRGADIFERRLGCDDIRTVRLMAMAFAHWGEAAKWVVGRRQRYDYGWMHWLMRMAMANHRHVEQLEMRLDGRNRSATIEALYFRTLVLDRFAGGNLTRQQIEVLDAWLWEWSDVLHGQALYPGSATFRADLDGKGGLRQGRRRDDGPCLYLPIAPLEARRREVIREFHRGRIVPSLGIAADFRVEEHVAVLDQLQAVFQAKHQDDEPRGKRAPTPSSYVDVWVGLAEILSRGLKPGEGKAPLTLVANASQANMDHRVRQVQFADENESLRRVLRLIDVSETGFGFEATEKEASGMGVGDVIGMRLSDGEPCVLGRVVRRVPGQVEGQVVIGVHTLTRAPQAITLKRTAPQGRPDDQDLYIYVPGSDDSGAQDSFLVPEKVVIDGNSHDARIGDDTFTLQFNRVRRKGRGWALAGFEIVQAKRIVPMPTPDPNAPSSPLLLDTVPKAETPPRFDPARTGHYPRFELAEDNGDPWKNELSARLL